MEVPTLHESRAHRAQSVGALHPKHRPGIGIAEVVQAIVVGDRIAADVVAGFVR